MAKSQLDETVTSTQFTLEKLQVGVAKALGGNTTAESLRLKVHEVPGIDGLVADLTAYILGTRIADDKYDAHFEYKVPQTWFQHWKQDKAPRWFVRRYPVRYEHKCITKQVFFTRFETYPMANLHMPDDQRTVSFVGDVRPIYDRVEQN